VDDSRRRGIPEASGRAVQCSRRFRCPKRSPGQRPCLEFIRSFGPDDGPSRAHARGDPSFTDCGSDLGNHLWERGAPDPSLCSAVDVVSGKAQTPPGTFARKLRNVADACDEIAARWKAIAHPMATTVLTPTEGLKPWTKGRCRDFPEKILIANSENGNSVTSPPPRRDGFIRRLWY
jgi:hypothetical protein